MTRSPHSTTSERFQYQDGRSEQESVDQRPEDILKGAQFRDSFYGFGSVALVQGKQQHLEFGTGPHPWPWDTIAIFYHSSLFRETSISHLSLQKQSNTSPKSISEGDRIWQVCRMGKPPHSSAGAPAPRSLTCRSRGCRVFRRGAWSISCCF